MTRIHSPTGGGARPPRQGRVGKPGGGACSVDPRPATDLAARAYWDAIHDRAGSSPGRYWRPRSYRARTIARTFAPIFREAAPASVLEVGCGNSRWLPYLARTYAVRVAGIDYSEAGAELARKRLRDARVDGEIVTADVFDVGGEDVGQFDLVYSLGVVEHFDSPERILKQMLGLVAPGGVLLTGVPNLASIHGLMMRIYQPKVLARHRPLTKRDLARAYARAGLVDVDCRYRGLFAVILSLGVETRWPTVFRVADPVIRFGVNCLHVLSWPLPCYGGVRLTAPYVFAVGRRAES